MDADLLESLSEKLYCGRPSSYHYTKALAESLVLHNAQNLNKKFNKDYKTAIIRPSIVTPTLREPLPGWTNNYYGPTGYLVVCGKGVLRSMIVHKDKICDIVPVDIVANTAITAAYYISNKQDTSVRDQQTVNCDHQSIVVESAEEASQQHTTVDRTNGHLNGNDLKQQHLPNGNGKFSINGNFSSEASEEDEDAELTTNGKLTNGHLANGHLANGHLSNGHLANGHLANGHLANGHLSNGHLSNGHLANGHLANGHLTNGHHLTNGKLTTAQNEKLTNGKLHSDDDSQSENGKAGKLTNGLSRTSSTTSSKSSLACSISSKYKELMNDKAPFNIDQHLTVFNCVSCTSNPISWGEIHSLCEPFLLKYPSIELFRYPGALLHSNKMLHQIILQLEHNIPAMLIDFVFKLLGHKPM